MAAILCDSISKILRTTCDATCTVLTLPCRACGLATDQITHLCRSPFCLFVAVAVGLNAPPLVYTARSQGASCESSLHWLRVNALLCSVNILAAVYISARISHDPSGDGDAPFIEAEEGKAAAEGDAAAPPVGDSEATAKTSLEAFVGRITKRRVNSESKLSRVTHTLCYDPWVALYIIVGVLFMIWQTLGMGKLGSCDEDDTNVNMYLSHSLICGFLFISLGGMAFGCSLCCLIR